MLHFADYRTLVLTKLAGRRFLRVTMKYAGELARHRRFRVTFHTSYVSYIDVEVGERPTRMRYEPDNQASLADACRELAGVIGPHAVANLTFTGSTLNTDGVGAVFAAAPPLKYAENLELYWPDGSTDGGTNPEVFMSDFAGKKTLRLSLDYNNFHKLSWSFLREESARDLRLIKVSGCDSAPPGSMNRSVDELVRYFVTLPHLQGGRPFELDFSGNYFCGAFGLRIIEVST